ncbi:MAG: methyltransferase domain-containing protein [Solirubrobacteraceae bacterium]
MTSKEATNQLGRSAAPYRIRFPSSADSGLDQDEEWCVVTLADGTEERLRFHDYHEIYPHPGLYEQIFREKLACSSPEIVVGLLERQLKANGADASDLSVLDLGAGNGMVGEELKGIGAGMVIGVDIIEEAAEAAERDRSGLYDDYLVEDFTDLPDATAKQLRSHNLNTLVCVAALGFGDIPPLAFATAYDLLGPDGWLAFNIRDEFLEDGRGGFARLIHAMYKDRWIELLDSERYVHRLSSVDGKPLHYVAMVARKLGPASAREHVEELEAK